MTEKEKMLSGKPYQAFEKELIEERRQAKIKVFEFNRLHPNELGKGKEILKSLLGQSGDGVHIEAPFRCDYGYNIEIGHHFFSNYNLVILDCAKVKFGNHVFIGPNVGIYTAGHPTHHEMRNQEYEHAHDITIGDNVWIGGNVVINGGVHIGDNCVIGSGSVVTKDVPTNSIAFGNPCRVMRKISEKDREEYLKQI